MIWQNRKKYQFNIFRGTDKTIPFSDGLNLWMVIFPGKFTFNFFNDSTISSFFPYKGVIPAAVKCNIVHKYERRICNSTYYGEYHRHFRTCVAEHRGISSRTGNPLTSSNKSNVFPHYFETGRQFCLMTLNLFSPQTQVIWKLPRASPFIDSNHRWMGWSRLFLSIY